ncbi:hypothetical protein LJR045_000434 [Microbacterium sp. LjRoot45]|uniref:hypothetical protein n=1 Tax=Microbacterium sp. LjRoot45 TaxID=3342329 RepID=UPI003ED0DB92
MPAFSMLTRARSWVFAVIIALVLTLGLVAVPTIASATEPVGTATGVSVSSTGATVLAGGTGRVTVRASNPSGADLYNASAVVVLPVGVTYVSGSSPAAPGGPGEPTVQNWTPDPNDPDAENPYTAQVLVWENVADLPLGASTQVAFSVRADDDRYPVGSSFELGAGVYANSNERVVPTVTVPASGAPTVTDATEGGSVDADVTVTAISVSKTEIANAEAEVYRGPQNPATWKVSVRTAPEAGSNNVVVSDYVPATFTVLGCADADYTCQIVELDGEVFTKLTWKLGDVARDRTIDLTYDAYVALREVTLPGAASPGAPTRPTTGGYGVTNTVDVTATYTGNVATGGSTSITTSAESTVTVLDVGVVKSAASGDFAVGGTKEYSFTVRTSEYVDSSDITVVDTIPDGMCPVLPAGVTVSGDTWPAECSAAQSGTGTVSGAGAMESVDFDAATGRFTVTFSVVDRDEDEDATVRYSVFMRSHYQDGTRTSAGDSFANRVHLEGTVEPVASNTVDSGTAPGDNDSSATVGTSGVSLTKTVWENSDRLAITGVAGAGTTCTATSDYTKPAASSSPALQLGDLVCFRIEATFPTGVATRDVQLTDFLPVGTSMVAWAASSGAGRATVTALDTPTATSTRWRLGELAAGAYYVAPGDSLQLYVLGRIDSVPQTQPRITGNLAKMRYSSGDGSIVALRDDVGVRLAPAPPLSLDKKVDGANALSPVQEGQDLSFTIDVRHDGTAGGLSDYPLDEIEVQDVLPAGFDCDDITTASPAITAADCSVRGGRVVVTWVLDLSADPLRDGETTTISYTLRVPSPLSIASAHTNDAAVTRFTSVSTNGIDADAAGPTFYPTNPIGAYEGQIKNAPQAADSTTISLPNAEVDKVVTATGVTETNNNATGQATVGETVTWNYSAKIPAKTTVFNGVLDELPPTAARWVAVGSPSLIASPAGITVADGCTQATNEFRLCTTAGANFGDLLFPTTWTNTTTTEAVFTVSLTMRVADVVPNANNTTLVNEARMMSTPTTATTGATERDRDDAQVTIVLPNPTIGKNVSLVGATGPWLTTDTEATGGQTVYYRLRASNSTGRPPLHEGVIVDCIDSRLLDVTSLTSSSVATVSGPVAGDGTNGCAVGRTKYTWTLAAALTPGSVDIVYSARVPSPIVASSTFVNTATISGTTMSGTVAGERTITPASANRTVTAAVPPVTKVKTSPTGSAVAGEPVTWRVTVTVPAGVNFYQARILDTLGAPLGIAADATYELSCGADWTGPCPTATRLPSPAGNTQVLGVYLDDIAAAPAARTLTLDVTSTVPTTIATSVLSAQNQARITWDATDGTAPTTAVPGTATSATATATVQIRQPRVSVSKSVSDAGTPKAQGEIFTYSATITASGDTTLHGKTAHNLVVVDTLPTGVYPVVSTTDGTRVADGATVAGGEWNAAARTITWRISSLDVGSPQTVTYPARLETASTLSGEALTNSIVPQSWTSLPNDGKMYGPGTASTAAVTPAFPRINTSKTQVTANPVYIGQDVSFTITLRNAGTATAVSMDAVDTLPANWSYVAGSTVIDGVAAADPSASGQTLTWADLGALTTNATHTITYQAVAGTSVAVGSAQPHTNTAVAARVTDATGGTSYNSGNGSYIGNSGQATALIHQADLRLAKRVVANTFVAGQTGQFSLTVTNNGPDPAVGVRVADTLTLPAGVTFQGASGTGWTCGTPDGSGVLTCVRTSASETLASGASFPIITVTVAIAADVVSGAEVPNTATVAANTEDRTPANNTATATGTVTTRADLGVVKTVTTPAVGAVTAGEQIEWSITLTNHGPSVSRGSAGNPIVLRDTLPSQVTGAALVGTAPDGCEIASGVLTCRIAHDLAVGDTITVRVRGTVDSAVAAGTNVIVNTASVTPVTTDPVTSNNISTVRTDVAVEEDLTIVKEVIDPAPPAPVTPGETVSYRVTVGNRGPSDARGIFVVDTLPEATTFDEITAGGSAWTASVSGRTVRFALVGTLAAGKAAPELEYTVTLAPAFSGDSDDLVNTATVSSTWRADQATDDAQPGPAQPSADLALTKTVRPTSGAAGDPVRAGETAIYTFTVDNRGPSDADAVTLTDTLPTGLTAVTPLPAGCTIDGQDLTCVKSTGLDADESPWTVQVTVRIAASFQGSTLTNAAEVASTTSDPVPTNNVDDVELPVIQRAHLTVEKTASEEGVRAGDEVDWSITIGNDGPSDARNVSLSDVLDARLALVSVDPDDDIVCTGTASLACTIGTIPAGGEVSLTVTTTVRSSVVDGATIPNTATATSTTIDSATDEPATATDDDSIDVVAVSELTIVKTAVQTAVDAGGIATFRLQVGNDGPSDAAASVVITDTLPDGLTLASASTIGGPAVWSCITDAQDVLCELQDADGAAVMLAAGADAPVLQIAAAVDPSLKAGALTNTATVTSPSESTPPSDDATVMVSTFADLGITKAAVGTPTAGERYSWTIVVTNHGPSDSVATADDPITIGDVLPDGTSFVSATGTGATCDDDAGGVACEITSTLAPGDSVTITVTVDVAEGVSGTLSNTATVTPGLTPEPTDAVWPNEATVVTPTVVEEADLAIEKTVVTDADDIVAGQAIRWELTVRNLGPSNSDADADHPIVVTDTLPAGVTATAVTSPGDGECTIGTGGATVSCELASDLATGYPQVIVIDAMVDADVQGTIVNTATVAPGLTAQPAGATDNDEDTTSSSVAESADLRLLKEVRTPIVAGGTGTYLIQVFNDGPSTARDVTVTDVLPSVLTFDRVVVADGETSPWTCAADGADPTLVLCTYDGAIPPGADPVELLLQVAASPQLTGGVTNRATVDSTTTDSDTSNNSDSVTGVLVTTADLVLTKTHDPEARAVAGEEFTWTVTVANDGPSDSAASEASPIVVTDTLPAGVTFVADGSDAGCAPGTDPKQIVCEITSPIASGDAVSFDVRVALDEGLSGDVTNTAGVVPGETADGDLTNNDASDTVTVSEVADLSIVKDVATSREDVVAGRQITWTVVVSNNGPSNSDADVDDPIRVVDTLPAGVSFVSAEGDEWTCLAGEPTEDGRQTIVCERVTDLPVGDAPVITVTGLIAPDVQGEVRNDVRVAPGLTAEPLEGGVSNNTSDAVVPVTEQTDLALSKAVSTTITAGGSGGYTLTVVNLGPSSARDVTVTDPLPDGLTYAGVDGDGWRCDPTGADVTCTFDGVLAPAASASFVLEVDAAADLDGDIENTAVVSTSTPDTNADNDTATASGTIARVADLAIVKTATGTPRVGDTFVYALSVTNNGPSDAASVRVSDLVPAGLEVVGVTGTGWDCAVDASTGQVLCLRDVLAVGATAPVIALEVRVLAAAHPEVSNTATVTATTPEDAGTLGDNSSTAVVAVPALSELSITKTLLDELVTGQQARYEVTVVNEGPTEDPGPVTVIDELPDGLVTRGFDIEGADGACEMSASTFTCTIGGLAVGQEVTITLTVDVAASASGTVVNTATVNSDADPTPSEASASGDVTVTGLASSGGTLAPYLPFGIGLLLLGAAALWWGRRRTVEMA